MPLVMFLAGFGCVLGALGVVIYQAFNYLKDGFWPALSVLDVLRHAGAAWAIRPTDWYGLHQALEWAPLSLGLFVVGGIVAGLGAANAD